MASCRAAATLSVRAETTFVTPTLAATHTAKTAVSRRLKVAIITMAPASVVAAMMSWSSPRCSTSESLSRSLVARLMVSPGWRASKWASGRRESFSAMRVRRERLSRSAKLAITTTCTV